MGFMQSKDKESLGIYLETLFDDSNYLISDDAWLWMYGVRSIEQDNVGTFAVMLLCIETKLVWHKISQ